MLSARELHPERTLADHCNPLAMDPKLIKAHNHLDRAVDRAFGTKQKLESDSTRQEFLFARFASRIQS